MKALKKLDYDFLSKTRMFAGARPEEIESMLGCLGAYLRSYEKGEYIYRMGEKVSALGLVLSGAVRLESSDVWGNVSVMGQVSPGYVFAETYAALPDEPIMVNVIAAKDTEVLFLNAACVMTTCSHACAHHAAVSRNLVNIFAHKNMNLSRRIFNVAPKTIRGKLLSYLSGEAQRAGSDEFDIPYNRQQLAEYLGVDRSAMSTELGKMAKEGLLETHRSHFVLNEDFDFA